LRKPRIVALAAALALAAGAVYAYQNPAVRVSLGQAVAAAVHAERTVVVPQGTLVTLQLEGQVGTGTSRVGESFDATVAEDARMGGDTVIPRGAEVRGHVIVAEPAGHISGHGRLQLGFDELTIGNDRYALDTHSRMYESASRARHSTEMIGGGALLGGLVGGLAGHSAGSALGGAVVGGAAGTAVSMASHRPDLVFAPGALLRIRLGHDLRVRVRPA
jgi:hypothetical protein